MIFLDKTIKNMVNYCLVILLTVIFYAKMLHIYHFIKISNKISNAFIDNNIKDC
jgi:hypothetical protein